MPQEQPTTQRTAYARPMGLGDFEIRYSHTDARERSSLGLLTLLLERGLCDRLEVVGEFGASRPELALSLADEHGFTAERGAESIRVNLPRTEPARGYLVRSLVGTVASEIRRDRALREETVREVESEGAALLYEEVGADA